jgi:hypothetical protein
MVEPAEAAGAAPGRPVSLTARPRPDPIRSDPVLGTTPRPIAGGGTFDPAHAAVAGWDADP